MVQRTGMAAGVLAGLLALAACGSDNEDIGGGDRNNASAAGCASGTLQAAGSSAQKPAFNAWIEGYQTRCGEASVNYDAQGSGAGRTSFIQGQVPLAGSDSALKDEEQGPADARCEGGRAVNLPMVATAVSLIYNLEGVSDLVLTPDLVAQIFDGRITRWDDAAIRRANPGAALPDTSITTVHRSADSGTTENFTRFLAAQSPATWPHGSGQAWKAPGGLGGKDSAAIVQNVTTTDGAIGYVDSPDAVANGLTPAKLDTGSGPVEISAESVGKALEAADTTVDGQDIRVEINYGLKEAGAYPAILVTYEITCTKGLRQDQADLVRSFLTYTIGDGQDVLAEIGHLPLPEELRGQVSTAVSAIGAAG